MKKCKKKMRGQQFIVILIKIRAYVYLVYTRTHTIIIK